MSHKTTEYLPTNEVAIALGLSRKTVLAHLASGVLTGRKIGTGQRGIWLVEAAEVERYQRERKGPGRPALDRHQPGEELR